MDLIISKLKSVQLYLQAHPDNEPDSEHADRISDMYDVLKFLEAHTEELTIAKQREKLSEKALQDIEMWDDHLEDEWGDPGLRAKWALKKLKSLSGKPTKSV